MTGSTMTLAATIVLLATGCSTHVVPLTYASSKPAVSTSGLATVVVGTFRDDRGTDANWLGAIRGGYGNRLKTLRTERPTSAIVEDAFRDALRVRGLLAPAQGATFELSGSIKKLDCSYYFNREAHAQLEVDLVDVPSHATVSSKTYRVDQKERGSGAGIFGSVETLRQLAEQTLRAAIDQVFEDAVFASAIGKPRLVGPAKPEERFEAP